MNPKRPLGQPKRESDERNLPIRFATIREKEIEKFTALYKERFGIALSEEEAGFLAHKYVHMFQILTYEFPEGTSSKK